MGARPKEEDMAYDETTTARWRDSRVIVPALTGLAWIVYATGFRAAAFPWFDAIGAAGAHVLPGALAGWLAWRAQARVADLPPLRAAAAHPLLALAASALWLALMLGITAAAKPADLAAIAARASQPTLLSGLVLYATIAFVRALVAARERAALREAALAQAELRALRARVEPHFLYNALETVSGLVQSDPRRAEDAIARLGRLLRGLLEQTEAEAADAPVPLGEELRFVRDYLAIEALRMGPRLRVIERIEPGVEALSVPRLLLQPLVENAVQHGLAHRREGGIIALTARREGGSLVLGVADDGDGTEEGRVREGGTGLALLRRRLALHHGGRSRFDVAATPGHGVSIRIEFPAVEAD
jgi:sensor histidine kinase YesM